MWPRVLVIVRTYIAVAVSVSKWPKGFLFLSSDPCIVCAFQNKISYFMVGLFIREPFIYVCDFVLAMVASRLNVLC